MFYDVECGIRIQMISLFLEGKSFSILFMKIFCFAFHNKIYIPDTCVSLTRIYIYACLLSCISFHFSSTKFLFLIFYGDKLNTTCVHYCFVEDGCILGRMIKGVIFFEGYIFILLYWFIWLMVDGCMYIELILKL